MKNIAILMMIGLFACTDMLEQADPTGPTGEDFFKTERDVQLAVVAAYGGLTNGGRLWGQDVYLIEQLTDHMYNGSLDGSSWFLLQYNVEDGGISSLYNGAYIAINRANLVLENAPLIPGITQSDLDNYLGQVYFIRGLAYFFLTELFGDVPIVLTPPSDPAGFRVSASSASEVYNQSISDFQMAEQLLPSNQPEAGRVTSLTATAMLAKVYLFGADELNQTSWYSLAQQKAEEVINSNVYSLMNDPLKTPAENFRDVFLLSNENGPEDIFAVQHFNDGGTWNNGNVANLYVMSITPRASRNINVWGYGWAYIYESVLNIWDDNDARKEITLWEDGEPAILDGDTLGFYDQQTQARPNARNNGGAIQKFWWAENFKRVVAQSDYNMKVLRYADLLLVHAEADLKADGTIQAGGLASINAVRNRAGLANLTAGEVDEEAILQERRWELFGEGGHRWFDLMRTRTAEQAYADIVAYDTDGDDNDKNGFVAARNYKLPYPQSAIDRNKALIQKPAWAGE